MQFNKRRQADVRNPGGEGVRNVRLLRSSLEEPI